MAMPGIMDRDPIPDLPPVRERRKLRERFGVTMQELADTIGVSRMTIHRWERGSKEPAGKNREEYAKILQAWKDKKHHAK